MELFITAIFFIGISLIATEIFNKVNKAAVAMFMGVTCWLLYIVAGRHFVLTQHLSAFLAAGYQAIATIQEVRTFIAEHVFLSYAMNAAGVVLYLLGTMTIIEVLENNGCFDFIHEALRTRRPKKFLWLISIITFLLSANLDNLTTTCLMLALLHTMVADAELRKRFGSIVVLAANCGGARRCNEPIALGRRFSDAYPLFFSAYPAVYGSFIHNDLLSAPQITPQHEARAHHTPISRRRYRVEPLATPAYAHYRHRRLVVYTHLPSSYAASLFRWGAVCTRRVVDCRRVLQ